MRKHTKFKRLSLAFVPFLALGSVVVALSSNKEAKKVEAIATDEVAKISTKGMYDNRNNEGPNSDYRQSGDFIWRTLDSTVAYGGKTYLTKSGFNSAYAGFEYKNSGEKVIESVSFPATFYKINDTSKPKPNIQVFLNKGPWHTQVKSMTLTLTEVTGVSGAKVYTAPAFTFDGLASGVGTEEIQVNFNFKDSSNYDVNLQGFGPQYANSDTYYFQVNEPAKHTVTFDKQNGSGGSDSVIATAGQNMPSITLPTRSGYAFAGYYTGTNGSGTQYYTSTGASANKWAGTANTTLYANWDLVATPINIVIANENISYGGAAPTYSYVAKIGEDAITDEAFKAVIANYVTLSSTYTQGDDAGAYDIVNSNANAGEVIHYQAENYVLSNIKGTLTVGKLDPVVFAPTAKELNYTGSAQELVNAGSTIGGTLQYKLGTGEWGTSIPQATDTGNYTVYYRVVGDTNYNDDAGGEIAVSIAINDKSELEALALTCLDIIEQIQTDYSDIQALSGLPDSITASGLNSSTVSNARTNPNVTVDQISNACDCLREVIADARAEIAKQLIFAIDDTVTLDSESQIIRARAFYDTLGEDERDEVHADTLEVLTNAEARLAELKAAKDNADAVATKISAIGEVAYPGSGAAIAEARSAYDALTSDDQRGFVSNYQTLLDAEAAYENLKRQGANDVKGLINNIGTVEYTSACKGKIDAAREAYDALTEEQKALISAQEYKVLTDAEAAYAKLRADHEAADEVIALINNIGTVELTDACKAKIAAANNAYLALAEDQKELVTNKQVLFDAIQQYDLLAHQSEINDNGVAIEGKDGELIPVNVTIKVEVETTVQAQKGTTEYQNIQDMLGNNEKIAAVYDVKLIQTINGVETQIQPSDIKEGMIIVVEITLPDGFEAEGLKILHIHSENDISYIENFKVEGNKVVFETDRLSEFAFVVPGGMPGWAIALIVIGSVLVLCALCALFFIFFLQRWVIEDEKVIRVFKIGKKDNKVRVITLKFKVLYREATEVYLKKRHAEEELNG